MYGVASSYWQTKKEVKHTSRPGSSSIVVPHIHTIPATGMYRGVGYVCTYID